MPSEDSITSRPRILFADDDDLFRRGLGERLERAGFDCDYADTAAVAIQKLGTGNHDVILCDIHMPGNCELEMLQSLPAHAQGVPVVLLTGRPSMETAARSVRLRAAAYLTKPPDFDELCALLAASAADFTKIRLLKEHRQRLQDWDREIERLVKLLESTASTAQADRQALRQSYVRLNLRNLVVGLVELESMMAGEPGDAGCAQVLERQDLLKALRKTVGVLFETRNHFKSKALGDLRRELETVLADLGPQQEADRTEGL